MKIESVDINLYLTKISIGFIMEVVQKNGVLLKSSELTPFCFLSIARHVYFCNNIFYLSLTMFLLNAITVKIMLTIINKLIGIKPKPAISLKE